jgi:hypothetical protein
MSHHPPVFTHAADSLEAEDWLKTVLKMLTTCQCDDREKVLYAAGRLQGSASAWWDAYTAAHAIPDTHLGRVHHQLQEAPHTFLSHEDQEEGVPLSQAGGMLVVEYRDKFTELSRYATEEVAEDKKK